MAKKRSPYHIVFHNGSMEGDCSEAEFPTDNPNITFKEALKLLLSPEGAKLMWDINPKDKEAVEDFIECNDDFVGAWIIADEDMKKLDKARNYFSEPGGDSECYAYQAAMKGLYKAFAIKSIGQKAK